MAGFGSSNSNIMVMSCNGRSMSFIIRPNCCLWQVLLLLLLLLLTDGNQRPDHLSSSSCDDSSSSSSSSILQLLQVSTVRHLAAAAVRAFNDRR